jgi:hypothetical protein
MYWQTADLWMRIFFTWTVDRDRDRDWNRDSYAITFFETSQAFGHRYEQLRAYREVPPRLAGRRRGLNLRHAMTRMAWLFCGCDLCISWFVSWWWKLYPPYLQIVGLSSQLGLELAHWSTWRVGTFSDRKLHLADSPPLAAGAPKASTAAQLPNLPLSRQSASFPEAALREQ